MTEKSDTPKRPPLLARPQGRVDIKEAYARLAKRYPKILAELAKPDASGRN